MNEGEAARTAFAIAQVTHLIHSFDERITHLAAQLESIEQRVESMAVAHNGLATELRQARDVILQRLDMHVDRLDKLEGK